MKAELILDMRALLGEGALWHTGTQRLFWVDIEGRKLHWYRPADGSMHSINVEERIGTVVLASENKAVIALQNGIHTLNLTDESLTLMANPLEGKGDIRFNDGKCDPAGRLWVGSMHLLSQPHVASLYRIDASYGVERVLDNITISNGIVWSLDHKTMYYIDSPTREIKAYAYDIDTGQIAHPSVAVKVPKDIGDPDGMTIDDEGMLWVAHWGGHCVMRWNPATCEPLCKVEVPAPLVTSCAFGGDRLDTLYITTARTRLSDEMLAKFPYSGGVFACNPGVRGVPAHTFGQSENA